jgi:general secretion pathway protein A
MYNEFYGFSEYPFDLIPNPRFLYLTRSHRDALSSMTQGIKNRNGFVSVTGDVGTGKTILVHSLLDNLGEKVKTVLIFHTTLTFNELLKTILSELHLSTEKEDTADLLRQLTQYVHQIGSRNEMLAIIIDEAQDLPPNVMKDLQMLAPLRSKGMKVVFVGQPGFEIKLNSEDLKPLKQSIETRRQIRPLAEEESKKYIDHRLRLVGSSSSQIFSPEAISLICNYSRGIPRVINTLCDNALLTGYRSTQKKIDIDIIRGVIKNMEGPSRRRTILSSTAVVNKFHAFPFGLQFFSRKGILIISASLLCLGAVIFLAYRHLQPESAKTLEIKSLKSYAVDAKPSSTSTSSQKTPPSVSTATPGREYTLK